MLATRGVAVKVQAVFGGKNYKNGNTTTKKTKAPPLKVEYGQDWYAQTREAAQPRRTTREEMEYRRQANLEANNGKDRKDLYTDNWDGDKYKGNPVNILTVLAALSVLVPVLGLVFAYQTYGVLWG